MMESVDTYTMTVLYERLPDEISPGLGEMHKVYAITDEMTAEACATRAASILQCGLAIKEGREIVFVSPHLIRGCRTHFVRSQVRQSLILPDRN